MCQTELYMLTLRREEKAVQVCCTTWPHFLPQDETLGWELLFLEEVAQWRFNSKVWFSPAMFVCVTFPRGQICSGAACFLGKLFLAYTGWPWCHDCASSSSGARVKFSPRDSPESFLLFWDRWKRCGASRRGGGWGEGEEVSLSHPSP